MLPVTYVEYSERTPGVTEGCLLVEMQTKHFNAFNSFWLRIDSNIVLEHVFPCKGQSEK